MLYGYGGSILRVDVGAKSYKIEPLDPGMAQEYIGGRGFIAKILYDELAAGIDPLGPKNKLVVSTGPLAGNLAPAGGKTHFGALSPATGGYGDSNMGGIFAAEMKYAGYDAIILEGAASEPCYIYIEDSKVEVRDAGKYWGKGAIDAEKMLKDDLGEEFQIAVIGPAGENLVKFACISHDFGRQAGRTGLGAVMGSKKVKAIAVKGTQGIKMADPDAALAKGKALYQACFAKPFIKEWEDYGTAGVTTWANEIGAFPTRNFLTSQYEGYQKLSGKDMRERMVITDKACFGCPSPCGKYSRAVGQGYDVYVEGPEYETTAMVGGGCVLPSLEDIGYANYVLDNLGLDTISGGVVIGWALECFEKGIITKDQAGRELQFGDVWSVAYLAEKIAAREGIGDILAEGVKAAAERLGQGSDYFAIHVKGLEWSGYDSRNAPANMLAYMTCDIGAHHSRAWAITHDLAVGPEIIEGKAKRVVELQHIRPMFDMIGTCRLQWVELGIELDAYSDLFKAITGMDYSLDDLLKRSERVWNLTRAVWIKHVPGFGRAFDYPPPRMAQDPVASGPNQGKFLSREALEQLLDEYYQVRGWDRNGIPTEAKLKELGLDNVAKELGLALAEKDPA
ncbi:MAG: aldehyde ferredoxin oxidoreductase family protein [Bacillota bacterium]